MDSREKRRRKTGGDLTDANFPQAQKTGTAFHSHPGSNETIEGFLSRGEEPGEAETPETPGQKSGVVPPSSHGNIFNG